MQIVIKHLIIPEVKVSKNAKRVYAYIPRIFSGIIEKGKKYYVYLKIENEIIPIGFKSFYRINNAGTLAIGLPKNLMDWSKIEKITLIVEVSS
ncbi:hypothetical protein EWF20_02620 [Sulfolobus sp. S-194]|uniref:hypothetical protein n=1 Tax=Sulfolobus sp. S-194 TaxID=2512240 RepID=UPI00143712B7|nr:hypothetical protein [Sulfolobus sp. S-194]QIW23149.1 hypothetical protein EWF20_02620 [Sulfolobus sp. S-194]